MTPQQLNAMKQALEALKWCHGGEPCGTSEAITAIEGALAEHAMQEVQRLGQEIEQEPVISKWVLREVYFDEDGEPTMYRSTPQRTWVGLMDEEAMDVTRKEGHELLDFIYENGTGSEGVEERIVAICKAIEAKLKEKNT